MTGATDFGVEEYLVRYDAFIVTPGLCHLVLSRDHHRPKVLLGELDDNPSTSVTNTIETIAVAVADRFLSGEAQFDLYEYVPRGLPTGKPTFYLIEWRGGRQFRWPMWEPISPDADEWLAAVRGRVKKVGYTSEAIKAPVVDLTSRSRAEENRPGYGAPSD